jgi:hypothetical protein
VRERFEAALERVVERARQDPYVVAAILCGSLSYDNVWEKSDIDLVIITRDEKITGGKRLKRNTLCLLESGVNVHAILFPRGEFRKLMDGSLRGSFIHSFLSKSRLLFSRDDTIRQLYENLQHLGARDRQVQLLKHANMVLPALHKAEKWLRVKKDLDYAFLYVLYCVQSLAQIEVAVDNQIAGREVIQQALAINPEFFGAIYTDLINRKKTARDIGQAVERIDQYVTRKIKTLFAPVLEYLECAGSVRSASEIENHFANTYNLENISLACEWLADKDVITKVSSPVRLTDRSRVEFDEMAFYYDGKS